jgi:SAM-dependent methyltransferase
VIFGAIPARVIVPEILDTLPHEDPRAKRSRQDLKFLNWFLGNSAWVEKELGRRGQRNFSVAELGAGEGHLTLRLARNFAAVTGLDLAPPPLTLPPGARWVQGDFFDSLSHVAAEVTVGTLILHHFDRPALERLGKLFQSSRLIIFVEPLRTRTSLLLCTPLLPFVGSVTRHDMRVSIRAGFLPDELASLLGLDENWTISETVNWRGTLRFVAWRD